MIGHDATVGSEVQANVSHGVVERAWTNEGRGGRSLDCKVWVGGGEAQDVRIMSVKEWSWKASTMWFMLVILAFGE